MKHFILYSLVLLLCLGTLEAKYPQGQMGIELSTINGSGLSYQMEIDRHSAIKFNGFAYFFGNPPDDVDYYFTLGVNYQRNIYKSFDHRVYGFIGTSIWYIEFNDVETVVENEFEREFTVTEIDRIWNAGLGLGYEYTFKDAVNFAFEVGLQYQASESTSVTSWIDRDPAGLSFFGIGGSFGLRFKL